MHMVCISMHELPYMIFQVSQPLESVTIKFLVLDSVLLLFLFVSSGIFAVKLYAS